MIIVWSRLWVAGITLWPFIILRKKGKVLIQHERIHLAQQKEMLVIPFYIWYLLEWLIRLPFGNAYRSISFEREAYDNQRKTYNRKPYAWFKYI